MVYTTFNIIHATCASYIESKQLILCAQSIKQLFTIMVEEMLEGEKCPFSCSRCDVTLSLEQCLTHLQKDSQASGILLCFLSAPKKVRTESNHQGELNSED